MPHLDTSNIFHKGEHKTSGKGVTIDGEAIDITDRVDDDDDTLSLAGEPEFEQPGLRDIEDTLPVPARLPHGPLRSLDITRLNTKWQLIEQLTAASNLNEWDLPDFIYRADMLDHTMIANGLNTFHSPQPINADPTATTILPSTEGRFAGITEVVHHLDAARVDLSYHEGFPAFNDKPFWQQLPFESSEAYNAFIFYLEQGGARKMTDLMQYDLGDVKQWFHTYYWNFRCKAFDLYRTVDATRRKLHRMISTEDDHYQTASKLMKSLSEVVQSSDFMQKLQNLDADKAVSVLEKLVKIQRVSVGLPANGGNAEQIQPQRAATTNIIMQQITEGVVKKAEEEDQFDMLVEDPNLVEMAQNLIIESQKTGKL